MRKKWVMPLCACALTLCMAISGAWADEIGISSPVGQFSSQQTVAYSFSMAGNALVVAEDGGVSLLDAQGQTIVPAGRYDSMYIPSEMESTGLIAVTLGDGENARWGVIDSQGRELVPPQYDAVRGYSAQWQAGIRAAAAEGSQGDFRVDGAAYVAVGADLYYNGQLVAALNREIFSYDAQVHGDYLYFAHATLDPVGEARDYSNDPDYAMDREYVERMGIILHYGSAQQAFSPFCTLKADNVEKPLWHNGGRSFRDLQSNTILCQRELNDPSTGPVLVSNGLVIIQDGFFCGLMDLTGRVVVPCVYDEIKGGSSARDALMASGYQAVVKNDMLGYLDASGQEISAFDCAYSGSVHGPSYNSPFAFYQSGDAGQYTVYTALAGQLSETFDDVIYPRSGEAKLLVVKRGGLCGVIDLMGHQVLPCEYKEIYLSYDGALIVCSDGEAEGGSPNLSVFRAYYADPAAPVQMTIHYVDERGERIAEDSVYQAEPKDYSVSPEEELSGWELISENPVEVTVPVGGEPVEITFVYRVSPAQVTVRYQDADGQPLAPEATLTLEAGEHTIEAPAMEGYTLAGPESAAVTVDPNGPSMAEVVFTYEKIVYTGDVTVHYVDESGQAIAPDTALTLKEGQHLIMPGGADISDEDYALTGEGEYAVSVGKDGASPSEVTFTYRRVIKPVEVTVHYVNEAGEAVASDTLHVLNAGTTTLTPTAMIPGHTLVSESRVDVTVDENGAEPAEVYFVYRPVVRAVNVRIHYVDENGAKISADTAQTLVGGTHTIVPKARLSAEEWELAGEGEIEVTVDAQGAHPAEVTFTYRRIYQSVPVTVRFVDEQGQAVAPDKTLTLEAGDWRILPGQSVSEEDYSLVGPESFTVSVTKYGASANEIVFVYRPVVRPAQVTVHYVDESGEKIAEDEALTLEEGTHAVAPAPDRTRDSRYTLTGESAYSVTVDARGASQTDVTFTYRLITADLTVHYADEAGEAIAPDAVLTLEAGAYRITPGHAVDPADYALTGDADYTVNVSAAGASPSEVTFVYQRVIHTADVTVRYLDETGANIIEPVTLTLEEGEYAIVPGDQAVSAEDYTLVGPEAVNVRISAAGASQAEVTFTYQRVIHPAQVTVHYVDENGEKLAEDAALTLEGGAYTIVPGGDAVPAQDYSLLEPASYMVSVGVDGASPSEVTFTYRRIIHPAQVTVHYVDETGEKIAEDAALTLEGGAHSVSPAPGAVDADLYDLTSDAAVEVLVDVDGASPSEVTFAYRRISADVAVHYVDQDGQPLAKDATLTLDAGAYRITPDRSAVNGQEYVLTGEDAFLVVVSKDGADPGEVTFTYRRIAADVTVHYVDKNGRQLSPDQVLTLNAGAYRITPAADAVSAEDYVLIGQDSAAITVDANGASQTDVTFTYRRLIRSAQVTVHYVDENGVQLAPDKVLVLNAGTYRITPAAGAVNMAAYALISEDSVAVTVDGGGASQTDVTFTYRIAANVTVHYVDENGAQLAPDATLTLNAGTYRIGPDADAVSAKDYVLISEDRVAVTVDASGASQTDVIFTYRRISAQVTVHYVDENGAQLAPDATLTLNAGVYRITPAADAVNAEDYALIGEDSAIVTVDASGASQQNVTFTYRRISAQVTVHYVDEKGAQLAPDATLTLNAGVYRITPAADAVSAEDYTLIGEDSAIVTVDASGASQADVTFTYRRVIRSAQVTVYYVDENDMPLAPEKVLTLNAGTYRITPAKDAVNMEDYALISEESVIVTVDENGASQQQVVFIYRRIAANITVHYVDESGKPLAPDATLTLEGGSYRIIPAAGAVNAEDYALIGQDNYLVTVDANGASLADVTFVYRRVIHPVTVTVHYVDETGAAVLPDASLTLEGGAHRIAPSASISAEDYTLTGSPWYDVTVDENGASQREFTFSYVRVIHPVQVAVHYVDENGDTIAPDAVLTLEGGAYRIQPGGAVSLEDYRLVGEQSYPVTVTADGASQSDFTFTYQRIIRFADVTVHYVDENGGALAPDAVFTLQEGTYRINPSAELSAADYRLVGARSFDVTVTRAGASPSEITFTYQRIIHPAQITVHYVDETGEAIYRDTFQTLQAGSHGVTPAPAAEASIRAGGRYVLSGPDTVSVTVDENGASQQEVTFTYRLATAQVTVRYLNVRTGESLAPDRTVTLSAGASILSPTEAMPEDYTLISSPSVSVFVTGEGASQSEVVFSYAPPTAVVIRYADEQGKPLAEEKQLLLKPGNYQASADADLPQEDYLLISENPVNFTVKPTDDSLEILFSYHRVVHPAEVAIHYVDESGAQIAGSDVVVLEAGSHAVAPMAAISDRDYVLASAASVDVAVTAEGASPREVTFTYRRVIHTAKVTVRYVDEAGQAVAREQTLTLTEGEHQVQAQPENLKAHYVLKDGAAASAAVTVTAEGASEPVITFVYRFAPPVNSDLVTGENLLLDSARVYRSGNGFVEIKTREALRGLEGQPVTVSFDIVSDQDRALRIYAYQESGLSIEQSGVIQVRANQPQRVSFTALVKDYGQKLGYTTGGIGLYDGQEDKAAFTVSRVKIEAGLSATDYTMSPNDPAVTGENLLQDSIRTRRSGNGFVEIKTREALQGLEGLPVTISFDLESSQARELRIYAYQESGLSIQESGTIMIGAGEKRRVSFTATVKDWGQKEGLTTGGIAIYDAQSEKAEFTVSHVKIEVGSQATDWTLAPGDPAISGENLLYNSARALKSGSGFVEIKTRQALDGLEGLPVTVSFDIESNHTRDLRWYAYQNSGVSIQESGTLHVPYGQKVRLSFTATVKDWGQKEGLTTGGIALYDDQDEKAIFTVSRVKIEVGAQATEWALAPDDPLITGENLLFDSARVRSSSNGFLEIKTRDAFQGLENLPVAVGFTLQSDRDADLRWYAYQDSGLSIAESGTFHVNAGEIHQVYFLTTVKDWGQKAGCTTGGIALYDSQEEKAVFTVSRIKLEVGAAATPWSMAPGDPLVTGENLLSDSLRARESKNGFLSIPVRNAFLGQTGQPITISFDLKGAPGQNVQIYAYQSSGLSIAPPLVARPTLTVTEPGYSRYYFTTTIYDYGQKEGLSTGAIAFYDANAGQQEFSVCRVKIELGFEPTAWSFAPNDPLNQGQNLLRNSEQELASKNGFLEVGLGDVLAGYEDQVVCVSFFARADEARNILVFAYGGEGYSINNDSAHALTIPLSQEYVRFWFTTTVRAYSDSRDGGKIVFYDQAARKDFTVRQLKIELGDTLTDWSPYPGE